MEQLYEATVIPGPNPPESGDNLQSDDVFAITEIETGPGQTSPALSQSMFPLLKPNFQVLLP